MSEEHKINKQTQQLIEACIKGDRQSQSRLYSLYTPKMFVVCLRYSKSREEAEEILQEGFMKVFEHLHQYKYAGPFEGWIRKIMVNCALQKYRSKGNLRPVIDIDTDAVDYAVNEDIISKIGTKELLKMVQELPPAYRIIFNLYVFEGMKHREIAELLGISEGTSKSNLSDARAILQKAVNKSLQSSQVKFS
ncbi:RNA polymerase sigma factor [Segetibacter koreensis]|uniref:RNA polymerase sigma factor n=1 Tax=Segetibacter koreensis TaxID=398037 RepID=UPI00036CF768|nr:RNA polymerase sigma factor [Segetibacter koreensis]